MTSELKTRITIAVGAGLFSGLLGFGSQFLFPFIGQYPSQFAQIADAVCDRPQEARARFFAAVNNETHRATVAHSCAEDER